MFYTVTFFFILVLILCYLDTRKPKNYPLGPRWYPIIGSAIQVYKLRQKYGMFCTVVDELVKQYANGNGLVGLKIGKDKLIIVHTADTIKELMLNEDLDGRPDGLFYISRTFGTRKGVIVTDGEFWQEQRRFIVKHLKEFGFARRGMAEKIENEVQHLLCDVQNMIKIQDGKKAHIQIQNLFGVYVLNTLWTMLAGIRYDRDNVEFHFPFLRYIAPSASGYSNFLDVHKRFYAFLQREVDRHKKMFRSEDEPRDLMDSYLRELESPDCKSSFSEKQLLAICLDMFLAGTETTNKSLGFAFLHMTRDITIQEKAQAELDSVIGRERLPSWDDRQNLPYCEAILHEALRFFMGNSFGVPHRALKETKLCGFDIPQDTMVIGCFRGMLMDENIYVDPKKFWPDRFIVNNKLQIPNSFAPFGAGRHRCMGEVLGRQNLFLFITTLLQNFRFLSPENQPLPDDEPLDGATPSVKPFTALVVPR